MMFLLRVLASLALLLAVVCAGAIDRPAEPSLEAEVAGLIEDTVREDFDAENFGLWKEILEFLKSLSKTAPGACIKKIFAACSGEPRKFIKCAKDYIAENRVQCFIPEDYYSHIFLNTLN